MTIYIHYLWSTIPIIIWISYKANFTKVFFVDRYHHAPLYTGIKTDVLRKSIIMKGLPDSIFMRTNIVLFMTIVIS